MLALHPVATLGLCLLELVLQRRLGVGGHRQAGVLAAAAAGMAPLVAIYAPSAVAWAHAGLSFPGGGWIDVPLVLTPWVVTHMGLAVLDQLLDVSLKALARGGVRDAAHRVARASAALGSLCVCGVPVLVLMQVVVAGAALAQRGKAWPLYVALVLTSCRVWVAGMGAALHAKARLLASLEAHRD